MARNRDTHRTTNVPDLGTPLLLVDQMSGGYGRKQVIYDVSLGVDHGEIVTLVGHNGAGKTTAVRSILGILPPTAGVIRYQGDDVTNRSVRQNVGAGMAMVPSENFVFGDLTVRENLMLSQVAGVSRSVRRSRMDQVFDLFPVLRERAKQRAGVMSGGQQRMLSLGLLLMGGPQLLLLDEPSLGLAPTVVEEIFDAVRGLAESAGIGVLLLEQNVAQALRISDRVYVMRSGRVIVHESASDFKSRQSYWDLF